METTFCVECGTLRTYKTDRNDGEWYCITCGFAIACVECGHTMSADHACESEEP